MAYLICISGPSFFPLPIPFSLRLVARTEMMAFGRSGPSPGWTLVLGMSSSFDSEVTFGKPKKKTKRPALKNGSLAANSLTLNDDSTLDADSEHDTLQLNPSASSSAFKSRMEPSLSFDDGDVREQRRQTPKHSHAPFFPVSGITRAHLERSLTL